MKLADSEKSNTQTLEYLLGVVVENREQRCAEVGESARIRASESIKQAHSSVRSRVHHHIVMLREKYRDRVSAAYARNQTLIRQHRQLADKECLEAAWPILMDALKAMWNNPVSRYQWLAAAIERASSTLLKDDWCIEHPVSFSEEEQKRLQHDFVNTDGKTAELKACDDIEAGIRIVVDGTVIDATLHGLLQQRTKIEAMLISRIKQDASRHD
jgi:hypothetical protein